MINKLLGINVFNIGNIMYIKNSGHITSVTKLNYSLLTES